MSNFRLFIELTFKDGAFVYVYTNNALWWWKFSENLVAPSSGQKCIKGTKMMARAYNYRLKSKFEDPIFLALVNGFNCKFKGLKSFNCRLKELRNLPRR